MSLNPTIMDEAKTEVLSCLNNASRSIHEFHDAPAFMRWWEQYDSGDSGLTPDQKIDLYCQLRVEVYTFQGCLDEYRRLLTGKPGIAMRIGDCHYAYLSASGELIGLTVNRNSTIDEAEPYDFDSSAFNTCIGGWMDEDYRQTRKWITEPQFVPVTVDPLPEKYTEFDHAGQRWSFNRDELSMLESEDSCFHFVAYHLLSEPTTESVIAFIESNGLG